MSNEKRANAAVIKPKGISIDEWIAVLVVMIFIDAGWWSVFHQSTEYLITGTLTTPMIAILGAVNVPIIKFSVDWWNTLHQPASINILSTNTAIHPSMLVPLGIMTAAFALFSLLIFLMKYNTELIKVKNKGLDRLW